MKELKQIKYWLFDLDNTLYSGDTKVFDQVDKKMTFFISDKLNVTTEDFFWITEELMVVADECCDGRIVSTLEGGYDLEALAESVSVHVGALMDC